jgi:hypothetical protein
VPILGGTFDGPGMRGVVVAGGADRQLVRRDGVLELDALYELRTDDDVVLTVRNQVLVDHAEPGSEYTRSHITIAAPEGRYGWLSRRVLVGTLVPLMPERAAVEITVYLVT